MGFNKLSHLSSQKSFAKRLNGRQTLANIAGGFPAAVGPYSYPVRPAAVALCYVFRPAAVLTQFSVAGC